MSMARGQNGEGDSRVRLATGVFASGVLGATAYWMFMSPYSQSLGPFPYRAGLQTMPSLKTVALTFDDGPNEPYTSEIAAFLDERGIKATFFQVGLCVARHPKVTAALAEAGHVIGNHSYSHNFSRGWTRRAIENEITLSQAVFREHLRRQPTLYRPPWLARTPALFDVLRERMMQPVSGEFCHALEVLHLPAHRIARGALAKARAGSLIIFHDGYNAEGGDRSRTVAAVRVVVGELSAQGYHFETVDRMLGVAAYVD